MDTTEFVAHCRQIGIPDYRIDAYLRGAYTPLEWMEIYYRFAR